MPRCPCKHCVIINAVGGAAPFACHICIAPIPLFVHSATFVNPSCDAITVNAPRGVPFARPSYGVSMVDALRGVPYARPGCFACTGDGRVVVPCVNHNSCVSTVYANTSVGSACAKNVPIT